MSPMPDDSRDDLSALAWVHEELRRSLDAAHKSLRRYLKETEALASSDIDAVDPAVLRAARAQIHQGVGALELVGQSCAAMVVRASEALVQRFVAKPHKVTAQAIDDIERASFALLDYLGRLLAGKPASTLSLFPRYRAVQEAAGAERVHPADLWAIDWQWRELPADPTAVPSLADAATHAAFEAQLLPLMRGANPAAAARMGDVCAGLGAGASELQMSTLWKLAAACFESQAQGLLGSDVFSKRVASRLFGQFRLMERGEAEVSERLAQDLLFFCAQSASPGDGRATPRLAAVRQAYGLSNHVPIDYSASVLGRFDPAVIAQARKRVVAAKEAWSAVAGGEMHRLTGLSEQFALVGESLKRLFPLGEIFAGELQHAVAQTQKGGAAPAAALAMEVATSLLYIEAALEDGDFDNAALSDRVRHLAARLAAVREGRAAQPLESWMEELYRRVSDRQTMGSVVQELRASLSEAEKLIDQYFRNPDQREVLIPVPSQLSAMRGVLSVLGADQASAALLSMRDEIDAIIVAEPAPEATDQTAVFERLAGNLGALGFLIDMLSVQPRLVKSLFTFDAEAGTLSSVAGRRAALSSAPASPLLVEPRLIEQAQALAFHSVREDVTPAELSRDLERLAHEARAADQPDLAAAVSQARVAIEQTDDPVRQATARGELSDSLLDFVATSTTPMGLEGIAVPAAAETGALLSAPMQLDFAPSTAAELLAQDDEMREVFLEEAGEVLDTAAQALAGLRDDPAELSQLTTLRRAFHTLKGSSRMVGLKDFGEAAWACEQRYNTVLADQTAAPEALLNFTDWCLGYLGSWVAEITERRPADHDAATVIDAAARIGDGAEPRARPLEVAGAFDLDLLTGMASTDEPMVEIVEPQLRSFEAGFDAPSADPAAADQIEAEEDAPLDITDAALQDPFDVEVIEPAPSVAGLDSGSPEAADLIDLDLYLDLPGDAGPTADDVAAPEPETFAASADADTALVDGGEVEAVKEVEAVEDDNVKVVGPLRIGLPLFNIYLNEADELSRRLTTEIAEWAMELYRPIGSSAVALAHSLAGSSATVGFAQLSQLARLLEHAQARSLAIGSGTPEEARLFVDAADEVRRLLHQFAAGFLKEPMPDLMVRLAEHELSSARRLEAASAAADVPAVSEAVPLVSEPDDGFPEPAVEAPQVAQAEAAPDANGPARSDVTASIDADLERAAPARADSEIGEWTSSFAELTPADTGFDPLATEPRRRGDRRSDAQRPGASRHALVDADEVIDAIDAVDAELFPIFGEEAEELLPLLAGRLRDWARKPGDPGHPAACMRTLHTLKGGARLAGAMRLGEMAHRLETRIEHVLARPPVCAPDVEALQAYGDAMSQAFEALSARVDVAQAPEGVAQAEIPAAAGHAESRTATALELLLPIAPSDSGMMPLVSLDEIVLSRPAPLDADAPWSGAEPADTGIEALADAIAEAQVDAQVDPQDAEPAGAAEPAEAVSPVADAPEIDWARFAPGADAAPRAVERAAGSPSAVRVRAPLLDRLVNQAGEVSITRSRIETGVTQIRASLTDLTENLERMRAQLRELEFQGELQMSSRLEAAKAASQAFDPLEFDRFTRFQEITRMMAESVNDVATVQRTLQRSLELTEDELVAQARMTRDLQDDLLRTRMVEFEGLSDRLYRVVRQAAKETGKSVRLDIVGGSIEVDRGVLDRMTGAFEHLLRNCVSHGIEMPAARVEAGKEATGSIVVSLAHEGNEVGVEFRDDGAGLDLARIRARAEALGLLAANAEATDAELANLIFGSGFSTTETITALAGRGVGMDVVRTEVNAIGGRIETATAAGQGTSFKLVLPLTTAVTQVVMLRCGATRVAVPSTLVEAVRRATAQEVDQAHTTGVFTVGDRALHFFWLGALLQLNAVPAESDARMRSVVVIRSAQQRIVLQVDEVMGNQEVVVKNLGPQLSRLPGLAGVTLLASGEVALIYNPVALATLYGDDARAATAAALGAPSAMAAIPAASDAVAAPQAPLVMVVDDSLTVRRVTQRLLQREGYRVVLAKDGLDALERLAEGLPELVLSDIEMPRMDGFDLVRNMRADARWRALPVIMITSRIAQKHRDYAAQLGVEHYLGKPYAEEDLLALIGRYTADRLEA